jgi:hypothetical protein
MLLALILIPAVLPMAGAANLNLASFIGTWENIDPDAEGIVKLIITDEGGIQIQAFGSCSPEPCDWGIVAGEAYGRNESAARANSFFAVFDTGNVESVMTGSRNGDRLRVEVFTRFMDGSGRADHVFAAVFSRG